LRSSKGGLVKVDDNQLLWQLEALDGIFCPVFESSKKEECSRCSRQKQTETMPEILEIIAIHHSFSKMKSKNDRKLTLKPVVSFEYVRIYNCWAKQI
jgi:hypothetical protein